MIGTTEVSSVYQRSSEGVTEFQHHRQRNTPPPNERSRTPTMQNSMKVQKKCFICDKVTKNGEQIHAECFDCARCHLRMNEGYFRIYDNKLYCEPDCPSNQKLNKQQKRTGPEKITSHNRIPNSYQISSPTHQEFIKLQKRCVVCDKVTEKDEQIHQECFECARCHLNMNEGYFRIQDNKLYCEPDCPSNQNLNKQHKRNHSVPKRKIKATSSKRSSSQNGSSEYVIQPGKYLICESSKFEGRRQVNGKPHKIVCSKCHSNIRRSTLTIENGSMCCTPDCRPKKVPVSDQEKTKLTGIKPEVIRIDTVTSPTLPEPLRQNQMKKESPLLNAIVVENYTHGKQAAQVIPRVYNTDTQTEVDTLDVYSGNDSRPVSKDLTALESICNTCGNIVYDVDLVMAFNCSYHSECFRCSSCLMPLKEQAPFIYNGNLYCDYDYREVAGHPLNQHNENYTDSKSTSSSISLEPVVRTNYQPISRVVTYSNPELSKIPTTLKTFRSVVQLDIQSDGSMVCRTCGEKLTKETENTVNNGTYCPIHYRLIMRIKGFTLNDNMNINIPKDKPTKQKKIKLLHVTEQIKKKKSEKGICPFCSEKVHQMEQIQENHKVYHKRCFRCPECHKKLGVGQYKMFRQRPYCDKHYQVALAKAVTTTLLEKKAK